MTSRLRPGKIGPGQEPAFLPRGVREGKREAPDPTGEQRCPTPTSTSVAKQQRISYHRQEAERRAREQTSLFGNADISPISGPPPPPEDPIQAFVDWSHETLRVPTGPLTDKPFIIPDWQREFLEGAFAPGVIESGLSVARKNGKSGIIAAYLLAHLAGPLCRRNWRGVVVS